MLGARYATTSAFLELVASRERLGLNLLSIQEGKVPFGGKTEG